MDKEELYTISADSKASNPGNVDFKPFIWIKFHLLTVFLLSVSLGLSAWLSDSVSSWFMIPFVISILANLIYWKRKEEHFKHGDSNGGLIVGTEPMLVAVTTNLRKWDGEYPVVKIIKYKGKGQLGDRIATVALYSRSKDDTLEHWIDFNPIPILYATNDVEVIEKAMNSYPEEQWRQLEARLLYVPKPYKEGLYKIKDENSDWKD